MKCVITAAGKGTRLLPITKELPKEMMPIFTRMYGKDRVVIPLLQYIFEQLYALNMHDYCFVVGREKRSIEDHFTPHESYLKELSGTNRELISKFYHRLEKSHIIWINQNKPRGFGDAVRLTEKYIGRDDFIVHAGDVAILSRSVHPVERLIRTARADSAVSAVLLLKKVKDTKRYGVPKINKKNSQYVVEEVEEKPDKPKSSFGILPLYYFKPEIFDYLKRIKPGKGDEYQLTDGIQKLIEDGKKVVAVTLEKDEIEIDVGTVESYRYSQEISYKKA
ncbi:sugar phosphate nucleotidyltransferase [Candidatus Nitrosotenuis cloacae]|uniref:sugar phosphate nucleotidyltransferase n=1 Tax=Candidatus Nitrosotenuis cloacae TaxID=1603555 RepID=UPI002282185D|nr:sugar phosphate nucleotidyltransferase [Candidatus Nitrosotenuis cloacae]